MAMNIEPAKVQQLTEFVALCKAHPNVLNLPQLSFLKEWLIRSELEKSCLSVTIVCNLIN